MTEEDKTLGDQARHHASLTRVTKSDATSNGRAGANAKSTAPLRRWYSIAKACTFDKAK